MLKQLLSENEDLFEENGEATTEVIHHIDTDNHPPIFVPPYRLNPHKKAELKRHIDEMLSTDIIEPSESPWAAPVVMVPKKDGGTRICIDYRRLNAITKPDRYPLPRMDDLLHEAKKTGFITALDLRAGYWQVSVKPEDQEKTAFTTPFGIYQFKRLPFGLRNAPATFQRLMDRFRTGMDLNGTVLAYLDDVLILSSTFGEHIEDLAVTFNRLRQFKLRINASKCRFCATSLKYLGHIITANGIMPDPEKLLLLRKWYRQETLSMSNRSCRRVHGTADLFRDSRIYQSLLVT